MVPGPAHLEKQALNKCLLQPVKADPIGVEGIRNRVYSLRLAVNFYRILFVLRKGGLTILNIKGMILHNFFRSLKLF